MRMQPLHTGDPDSIGGYRLEGRLGAGGMGQVFVGSSPSAEGRKVAVKVIRPEYAENPQFRARFTREVEAARKVGGIHTAQVVDADTQADSPWLVTEFIAGPSLHEMVGKGGPLTPEKVRLLGAGLAEGLAAIHRCELIHRDLKPGNVIMASDGPQIIDFGIARSADASALTSVGAVVGTFAFMSPEQVRAEPAVPASDVFSLGCVLGFAATGHSPFDADSVPGIVHKIINRPPELDDLQGDVREVIAACLVKDSTRRPSVAEITARLTAQGLDAERSADHTAMTAALAVALPQTVLATVESPERLEGPAVPQTGGLQRRTLLLAALGGVGVAGAGIGAALWPDSNSKDAGGNPGDTSTRKASASPAALSHPLATFKSVGAWSLAFSPDGTKLVSIGHTESSPSKTFIRLSDAVTGHTITTLSEGDLDYTSLALNKDGGVLAVSGHRREGKLREKAQVQLWDMAARRVTSVFDGYGEDCTVAFSHDGTTLAISGQKDATEHFRAFIEFRDTDTRRVIGSFDIGGADDRPATAMAFSPDGQYLAAGSSGKNVSLWDVVKGREKLGTILPKAGASDGIAFSPDGKNVAVGSAFIAPTLWDTSTGNTSRIEAAVGVAPVAFSPDGKTLALGGSAGSDTVWLWDVARRRVTATLRGDADDPGPASLAFSPDGRTLAFGIRLYSSSGEDAGSLVRLWRLP
ncbi:WD40 repeat domain-containing serine/threonine protein kinase [Streptomyces tubbatahanensis]|uniref:WD40 repeat domain-containing serine/threonine protein kinase n=1 Tax=Streptomyces tubbatahanensis TaxID=2923272 RepID=A0ABY3XMS9_9ACTN|nr:WD40 repeat domain-containing serine/threonine protein kinase [Streptomyces tubbatahanensis]UNS95747.1 WD40 repeat domain-containing serine/threonine protein kinase [Streptomyces tubbatahanensis]